MHVALVSSTWTNFQSQMLRETVESPRRRFDLDAFSGVQNEDDPSEQTVYSELSWRLKDRYTSKAEYYFELFREMSRIVQGLRPRKRPENLLDRLLKEDAGKAQRLLRHQEKRFNDED